MSRLIIVEGPPDRILVSKLGFPKKWIKKVDGKGNIANHLRKLAGQRTEVLVGMVDQDPGSTDPSYFSTFQEVKAKSKHNIKVSIHRKNEQLLIEICPRLEEWILKSALSSQIDLKKMGIPTKINEFKKITSQRKVSKKFEDLIQALISAKSNRLEHLRAMLDEDIKELIKEFDKR